MIVAGKGKLVVARRPSEPVEASEYAPCSFCLMFCKRDSLHVHINRPCPLQPDSVKNCRCENSYLEGLLLIEPFLPKVDLLGGKVNELMYPMRDTSANEGRIFYNLMIPKSN